MELGQLLPYPRCMPHCGAVRVFGREECKTCKKAGYAMETPTTVVQGDVDYDQELADLFGGEPPEWVTEAKKSFIRLKVSDWQGGRSLKVTVKDVTRYYAHEAKNISSGCRALAGYVGDWRPIDELAQICLNWFKRVNRKALVRAGKSYGMELRG